MILVSNLAQDSGNGSGRSRGRKRSWVLVIVLFAVGLLDLVLRGWVSDARVCFLVSVAAAGLLLGQQAGLAVLGVGLLDLLFFGLWLAPRTQFGSVSPNALIAGVAFFVLSGLLVLWILRYLTDQSSEKLSRARQEERLLARTVLDTRLDAVQATNRRLQRRVSYLEASLYVSYALSVVPDVGTILNRAVDMIAEQFGFTFVALYLMEGGTEWATLRGASSVAGKELALRGLRLRCGGEDAIGWVAAHGQPLARTHIERQSDGSGYLTSLSGAEPCATLTLPLLVGQHTIGVLDIYSAESPAVSDDCLSLLVGLVNHLALLTNRAQKYSDESAMPEMSSLICRTARRLAVAHSDLDVYEAILEAVDRFGSNRTLIVRRATGEERLLVVADRQNGQASFQVSDLAALGSESLVDVAILGLALDRPLWVHDLADLDIALNPELRSALAGLHAWPQLAAGREPAALALVPILMDGIATQGGVLVLYENVHRFSPSERHLHELLTELGGAALERSRLVIEDRDREEREKLLLSVRQRLRRSLDPDAILRTAAKELGSALNGTPTAIEIAPQSEVTRGLDADMIDSASASGARHDIAGTSGTSRSS